MSLRPRPRSPSSAQGSTTTSSGRWSGRRPRQDGWRRRPVRVHSLKRTSPTSSGSTQFTPAASARGTGPANGRGRPREAGQAAAQCRPLRDREAGADPPHVVEARLAGDPEQQRAELALEVSLAGRPPPDDDRLRAEVLDLAPARVAHARAGRGCRAASRRCPRARRHVPPASIAAPPPRLGRGRRPVGPGQLEALEQLAALDSRGSRAPSGRRGAGGRRSCR